MKVEKKVAKVKQISKKVVALSPQELHNAIKLKAYELYLERNGAPGNELEDWAKAKKIVLQGLS